MVCPIGKQEALAGRPKGDGGWHPGRDHGELALVVPLEETERALLDLITTVSG